jgi:hypothetical protein
MTSLSRQSVLKGAAALGGTSLFSAPSFADSSLPVLRAAPASAQLAPDGCGQTKRAWAVQSGFVGLLYDTTLPVQVL